MPRHGIILLLTLICLLAAPCAGSARVSVNVPVGHWSYRVLDKLSGMGLIQSDMLSTKPITRLRAAQLTREAEQGLRRKAGQGRRGLTPAQSGMAHGLLQRLRREFGPELRELGGSGRSYIKPVDEVRLETFYGQEPFDLENDKRRPYSEGVNSRASLTARGAWRGRAAFLLQPELAYSGEGPGEDDTRADLLTGYGKLQLGSLELQAGRDSLWWGPGRHGSLILTDNAPPLNLIKLSNPEPFQLPWYFRYFGLIKAVGFLSELENGRDVPGAQLMGFRVEIKPVPWLEIGGSRTIILGGDGGSDGVMELSREEWSKVFSGRNIGGDLNTNQIAGGDVSLLLPGLNSWLPLQSAEMWLECYGEDEANGLPSKPAWVAGLQLNDLLLYGTTNIVLEYADTVVEGEGAVWYTHSAYTSGYRYLDQVLGHHMGTDARQWHAELSHYLSPDLLLCLAYTRQRSGYEAEPELETSRYDVRMDWFAGQAWQVQGMYRLERFENDSATSPRAEETNHIAGLSLVYSF